MLFNRSASRRAEGTSHCHFPRCYLQKSVALLQQGRHNWGMRFRLLLLLPQVFADSITSKEDAAWWRGFRFASGPSGGIGMFPSSHVTLLPLHPPPPPSTQNERQKKKTDFSTQTDVTSSSSSSTEDDGEDDEKGAPLISEGIPVTFPHSHQHLQRVCPTIPLSMNSRVPPPCFHRMTSVTSASTTTTTTTTTNTTLSHPRGGYRAASVQPCASSTCSSTSSASSASSGASSCSSCAAATVSSVAGVTSSCDRSPVELLVNWLLSAGFSDYTPCLVAAGYDLSTLRRATPEDLNACGVTNPRDRQQLRARLSRLQLPENLPDHIPACVFEWLSILNLTSYWPAFQTQGLTTFEKIVVLTWEDLEEIGITKLGESLGLFCQSMIPLPNLRPLGHQKKIILAIERLRRALSKRNEDQSVGTDSLIRNRQSQQQQHLSSPSHPAAQPLPIEEERETMMTGNLADLTPPPPPGFQDPPHVVRKASLDFSPSSAINPGSPEPRRITHHRHHFSTSFLTDIGRLGSNALSSVSDTGAEGSTKSDPLPRVGACEGEEVEAGGITEEEKDSKSHPKGVQQSYGESFPSVRQRHRNAVATAITIPGKKILMA
ncbi:unnamed protein product [Hydatigera taeniaeformis]|uniref:Caskin-1 n=1 Tax=Hydatigena taeniaeformis TaxID=6205 RepID=A0A158RDL6_HYDTA|nr:unnamed protein product [Hydatigera taeniaeformis]